MTKHIQTRNSTAAANRFNLKRLLRTAVTASVVTSCFSIASAQTDLALPPLPSDTSGWSLPVSQESATQPTTSPPATPATSLGSRSAAQRVSKLLGLKKSGGLVANQFAAASVSALPMATTPTLDLPAFPSTAARNGSPAQLTSNAPEICRSSGSKSQVVCEDNVVLASAQELPKPPQLSPNNDASSLVPPSLPTSVQLPKFTSAQATSAQATFTDSSTSEEESADDSLSESLIDIEIPLIAPAPVAQAKQRLPALVKRPPAMQLHIGGEANRKVTMAAQMQHVAPTPVGAVENNKTKFSLSDSSSPENQPVVQAISRSSGLLAAAVEPTRPLSSPTNSNPMNVRIEGEPGFAKAINASPSLTTNKPISASPTPSTIATKSPSVGNSSRNATHKSVSDNTPDPIPAIGERLEVDLHEATNVETSNPISGLSIEHPELCQVLKSGERTISLVGLKAGQTRVALFTSDAAGDRKIEIRDVVIAGTETRQADMKSMAVDIGRSVHNMYPKSRIEVIAEAEGLTVQGYASTEDEAKKIISLVRRTSLQPVVDRLATYK